MSPAWIAARAARSQQARPSLRQGSIATQAALVLPVVIGFAALAVDAAYLYVEDAHLQSVTDAAALAGASGFEIDESTVDARALAIIAENMNVSGGAYSFDANDVDVGTWDGSAFTETSFAAAVASDAPAVRVQAPGQPTALFFARLFRPSGVADVASTSVVARAPLGIGLPQNCGILSDTRLSIGGSQAVDGYSSDDCSSGSLGYDPATRDPQVGICSNDDTKVSGGANNEVFGSVSYGPEGSLTVNGNPAMYVDPSQLAEEVTVPPVQTCSKAEQAASDAFLSNSTSWGGCFVGNAKDFQYDPGSHDLAIKGKSTLTIEDQGSCNAPDTLCVGDLTTGASSGALQVRGSSFASGKVTIKATGDVAIGGKGLVNLGDTNPITGISSGNNVGELALFVGGDMDLVGQASFSGVVVAGGVLDFRGTADVYGAFFSHSRVEMNGNMTIHIDRCYELSTGNSTGNTETIAVKMVLVQ